MAELDLVRLRELAAELGYWPASTDEEHVARLRTQDARYNEQESQDPGGTKWQKMMGAWVTQVKKSSAQDERTAGRPIMAIWGPQLPSAPRRPSGIAEANRRSKERPTGTHG
jgi:hypothetical protein